MLNLKSGTMIVNNLYPKNALRLTRLIYFSLLSGISMFLVVVLIINSHELFFKAEFSDPLLLTLLILSFTLIPAGLFIARKYCSRIDPDTSFQIKYPAYQTALLMRLAACDAVSMFAIVLLLLTGNLFSLFFLMIAVLVIILHYPTPFRIGADLNLTETELEQFN